MIPAALTIPASIPAPFGVVPTLDPSMGLVAGIVAALFVGIAAVGLLRAVLRQPRVATRRAESWV